MQPISEIPIGFAHAAADSETLNHISQQCFYMHGLRILRHNTISKYLARSLSQKGYTVHKELIFKLPNRAKLKPDLIAYKLHHTLVIGSQIMNDQYIMNDPLSTAHNAKVKNYDALRPQLDPL